MLVEDTSSPVQAEDSDENVNNADFWGKSEEGDCEAVNIFPPPHVPRILPPRKGGRGEEGER